MDEFDKIMDRHSDLLLDTAKPSMSVVYFAQPKDGGPIKIGWTANLKQRLSQLESIYGVDFRVLTCYRGGKAKEQSYHQKFAHLRIGKTEQFRPTRELVEFLKRGVYQGDADVIEPLQKLIVPRNINDPSVINIPVPSISLDGRRCIRWLPLSQSTVEEGYLFVSRMLDRAGFDLEKCLIYANYFLGKFGDEFFDLAYFSLRQWRPSGTGEQIQITKVSRLDTRTGRNRDQLISIFDCSFDEITSIIREYIKEWNESRRPGQRTTCRHLAVNYFSIGFHRYGDEFRSHLATEMFPLWASYHLGLGKPIP